MTMKQTESRSHREIQDLLPWYVNGTLSRPEHEEVGAHLAVCADCAAETGLLQSVSSAVKDSNERLPSPSDNQLDALLSRIKKGEAAGLRRRLGARLKEWWEPLPAFAKWALVAQAVAVITLACASAVLLRRANLLEAEALRDRQRVGGPEAMPTQDGQEIRYKALSGQQEEAAGPVVKITVVFREDATEKEIRELLKVIKATIVSGPSPVGFYVLSIAVPPDSDARKVTDEALERLRRRQDVVRLAEPQP